MNRRPRRGPPMKKSGGPTRPRAAREHNPKKLQTFWIRSCDKTKIVRPRAVHLEAIMV